MILFPICPQTQHETKIEILKMNRFSTSVPSVVSRSLRYFSTSSLRSSSGAAVEAAEFGFQRPEFGREKLAGTVKPYERHVFVCCGSPDTWQPIAESWDGLPRLLSSAIKARRGQMKKKTVLTICEGEDETSSCGDILIFPDMIRYRRLTCSDLDKFVEEVLVKETGWLSGSDVMMVGSYVFVCAHGSRDRRCGVCGPVLISKFKEEISLCGLQGQVYVKPCSHIGGHKYAGNVIIFSQNMNGEVSGHWYGYVSPDDVPLLLEEHIGNGKIVDRLWRGQMGLSQDDWEKAHNYRLQPNDETIQANKPVSNESAKE